MASSVLVSADFGAGAQYAFLTLEGDIFHYFLDGFETGNFASAHGSVTDEGGVKTLSADCNNGDINVEFIKQSSSTEQSVAE